MSDVLMVVGAALIVLPASVYLCAKLATLGYLRGKAFYEKQSKSESEVE